MKAERAKRIRVRYENGVFVPLQPVEFAENTTYLIVIQPHANSDAPPIDALAEIAKMAVPLGPPDLAENFDTYTKPLDGH